MRFRLLLTNGRRTVDVIWATHTGKDLYYGYTGANFKDTYHASGVRHTKWTSGERSSAERHHRLDAFTGQLQLCAFGISTNLTEFPEAVEYKGMPGDSVVYLDSRTLPNFLSVSFGLLECNNFGAMLPVWQPHSPRLVHIVPSTVPWIYVVVYGITTEAELSTGTPQ